MSPRTRELFLAVIDDRPEPEITFYLFEVSRHARCNEILEHLVRNRIRGLAFIDFVRNEHSGSILNFMSAAVRDIDRDVIKRPMIFGRDYI